MTASTSSSKSGAPADRAPFPPVLTGGDVLLLGQDGPVPRALAFVLDRLGARGVEIVEGAEAALDLMGDDRRRWRLVIVLPPTEDLPSGRLLAVLRDLRYPVHASAIVDVAPWDTTPRPDLVGCAMVSDLQPPKPFARSVIELVDGPWTIAHVVESARVPPSLPTEWARAVYGAPPGRSWRPRPS